MALPKYMFCNNKSELPNDSLMLQTTAPPYIMAKVWQFPKDIPDGFINSTAHQVKIKGYRMYLRYYDCLEGTPQPEQVLLTLAEMADYLLINKIEQNPGAYRRYKE